MAVVRKFFIVTCGSGHVRAISDCCLAVESGSCWIHLLHHLLPDSVAVPVDFAFVAVLWRIARVRSMLTCSEFMFRSPVFFEAVACERQCYWNGCRIGALIIGSLCACSCVIAASCASIVPRVGFCTALEPDRCSFRLSLMASSDGKGHAFAFVVSCAHDDRCAGSSSMLEAGLTF